MRKTATLLCTLLIASSGLWAKTKPKGAQELFPDGSPIPAWFATGNEPTRLADLGRQYVVTDYGVAPDSTLVQTRQLQAVIDRAAADGGGVVVVPEGTFMTGALFFKPGTHLYVSRGAVLRGSDDISDYPVLPSRMEGQNLNYFPGIINAWGCDGFTLSGEGTIDGNGLRSWKSFWQRRAYNPKCTNLDELRPRLLFVWGSNNVKISGLRLVNSPFWTTHFYKCDSVKLIDLYIFSPAAPVKAPSTDGVDIDACNNFLIKGCYISVNDDGVALKGGKGPWADTDPDNGANTNVIIEDTEYGFCHGVLTCGSESIHDRNIIVRRIKAEHVNHLLWLKMRPDTPQLYEHILVEDVKGSGRNCLYSRAWKQFFDLKGREDIPMSYGRNVTLRNIDFDCNTFFDVEKSDQFALSDFLFDNLNIRAEKSGIDRSAVDGLTLRNVIVNGEQQQ